jgi:chromate reductase
MVLVLHSMMTIISGTNRKGSRTRQVAQYYWQQLQLKGIEAQFLSLEDINASVRDEPMKVLEQQLLFPSQKFIIVMPEYNGSFPGILKALLDNTDIRHAWWYKKAMLVGVADGRGGNLRGIEHMTNILHYLKVNVYYNKLPLSRINEEMDEEGRFLHANTIQAIDTQIEDFLLY